MSTEIIKKVFDIVIPYYKEVRFIWHGAEPLSVGKEFYKDAFRLQNEYSSCDCKVTNSIQTNLTLIDDDFARLLIMNNVKMGSSFDGTSNELTRHNSERILKGYSILRSAGGECGFIYVLQNNNIDRMIEDYEWFKKKRINYTINPYLPNYDVKKDPLFVPANKLAEKICFFFDYWKKDVSSNIHITFFDVFIDYCLWHDKILCCYNSCMGKHIGISQNGTISGCNRYFPPKYDFGCVFDYSDIHECFESEGFLRMIQASIHRRNTCKQTCDIYDFCAGGCNNVAFVGGDIEKNNDYTCTYLKTIFKYITNEVLSLIAVPSETLKTNYNPQLVNAIEKFKSKGTERKGGEKHVCL